MERVGKSGQGRGNSEDTNSNPKQALVKGGHSCQTTLRRFLAVSLGKPCALSEPPLSRL